MLMWEGLITETRRSYERLDSEVNKVGEAGFRGDQVGIRQEVKSTDTS